MSGFKVTPPKKPVDPARLEAFSAGAEQRQVSLTVDDKPISPAAPAAGKPTESMLFRLTKEDLDEFNFVFENTNVKSKQKLLEAIILPEIRRRAAAIRGK